MKVGLFPGSFDPFHNGHLEMVERATRLFDEVVVAALRNPQKSQALFDLEERQSMLEEVAGPLPAVRIVSVSTLVVNVARDVGATAIVRGLRAVSDFETEMQMAQMNHHLSGVETIFIPTSSNYSFIASKLVREVARFGGDVSAFVPKVVAEHLGQESSRTERGRSDRPVSRNRRGRASRTSAPRRSSARCSRSSPAPSPCRSPRRSSSRARR